MTYDQSFQATVSFEQRDRDILVADRDAVFEIEFLPQSHRALEPLRAFLWITLTQAKGDRNFERERNFHVNR